MAYKTLYRKYRPKSFDMVFGQDVIVKTLKNVIKNNKLSHAYLFTGPRGTGKTSCAKLFAKAINCTQTLNGDVCNLCDSCISFNNNSNPDIIEIDAASNNGVEEIREIRNKVNLVPSISKFKVYIIDEVHMLSIGAFNALLKTLEEPPKHIIFILATTEPQKLPSTVISRCQRFDFKSISKNDMNKCLNNIIEKENINIEQDAINEIILNSNGGMRDAIGMLDQAFAFTDDVIKLNDIQELSGNISNKEIEIFINNIYNKDYKKTNEMILKWEELGKDLTLIVKKIIFFLKNGILYKKKIIDCPEIEFYNIISESKLYEFIDEFINIYEKIQQNGYKKMIFDVYILKLLSKVSKQNNILLIDNEENNKNNKKNNDVPRETLSNEDKEVKKIILQIKEIRINNILLESSKFDLEKINEAKKNLNKYLINDEYKTLTGLLIDSKVVAASSKGIIITVITESILNKIEENYDCTKKIILDILDSNLKIVFITENYWKKIRPKYVELVKNKEIKKQDETIILKKLKKLKNDNSLIEFNELIEMENK